MVQGKAWGNTVEMQEFASAKRYEAEKKAVFEMVADQVTPPKVQTRCVRK